MKPNPRIIEREHIERMLHGFGKKGLEDFFVEISVDVVGTPLDPSDRLPVRAMLNN